MIDRPDRADFPSSKIYPKPNFETLPQRNPRLFLLGPAASLLQPLSLRRAEAVEPVSPVRGLRGLETKGLRRRRGRQDRPLRDSSAPPNAARAPPPPPRLTGGSGARGPAPAAAAAQRTMAGGGASAESRALCGARARRLLAD